METIMILGFIGALFMMFSAAVIFLYLPSKHGENKAYLHGNGVVMRDNSKDVNV